MSIDKSRIEVAMAKGMAFLRKRQLPWGEFRTYCSTSLLFDGECLCSSSPFMTTFVLYALQFVKDRNLEALYTNGLNFLIEEMQPKGFWKYYGMRSKLYHWLSPDVDDTSCAAFLVSRYRPDYFIDPSLQFQKNSKGLYYTFIDLPMGDCDCVVNANALLLLGDSPKTQDTIRTLTTLVETGDYKKALIYYPDETVFHYCLSRAYFNGTKSLDKAMFNILQGIDAFLARSPAMSSIKAACTLSTILNFADKNINQKNVAFLVNFLLQKQHPAKGNWSREVFFRQGCFRWGYPEHYFGSEDLTTALALEGLARAATLLG